MTEEERAGMQMALVFVVVGAVLLGILVSLTEVFGRRRRP
jgi:hypothetical protein